jgi:hypothetical protein
MESPYPQELGERTLVFPTFRCNRNGYIFFVDLTGCCRDAFLNI